VTILAPLVNTRKTLSTAINGCIRTQTEQCNYLLIKLIGTNFLQRRLAAAFEPTVSNAIIS
jgi:hypothetical protein